MHNAARGVGVLTICGVGLWATSSVQGVPPLRVAGDLDGDGALTPLDLNWLIGALGTEGVTPAGGDLTGNGVVDEDDVRAWLEMAGAAADSEDVFYLLASNDIIPPIGMSMMGSAHHPIVSSTSPQPPGGPHGTTESAQHPNHGTVASTTWPHTTSESSSALPPGPAAPHDTTVSNSWPSNHQEVYSDGWPQGLPPTHDVTRSDGWPPQHQGFLSIAWPDPSKHENSISFRWPPNHNSGDSGKDRFPHVTINSDSKPQNHQSSVTTTWPNNHRGEFSKGWPGHTATLSATWPPNHLQAITQTWTDKGHKKTTSDTWPPNWHDAAWSTPSQTTPPPVQP